MKTILDASSVIYGGHHGRDRRLKGFPIGGLRKLFGIINQGLTSTDFAICFDSEATLKKELLPTYKAGRVPDYSIMAQMELARELLAKCEIPYYQEEGYEADDLVFSLCTTLATLDTPDRMYIYTDDRDLSCCVTSNTTIMNVTSNGIIIDKESFASRVVKGHTVPYNTILLWKVLKGDTSDNYTGLHIPGADFDSMAESMVAQVSPLIGPTGFTEMAFANYEVFCVFIDGYKDILGEDAVVRLKKQGRIVYPYEVKVLSGEYEDYYRELHNGEVPYRLDRKYMKFFGNGNFNMRKFEFYCNMFGLNRLKGSYLDQDTPEAQEFYNMLELRAKSLTDGTLAVKYYNKKHEHSSVGTLQNMSLPD